MSIEGFGTVNLTSVKLSENMYLGHAIWKFDGAGYTLPNGLREGRCRVVGDIKRPMKTRIVGSPVVRAWSIEVRGTGDDDHEGVKLRHITVGCSELEDRDQLPVFEAYAGFTDTSNPEKHKFGWIDVNLELSLLYFFVENKA